MKVLKILFTAASIFVVISSTTIASAGDFDWIKNLNIRAQADLTGFKATLATRFKIGNAEVNAVLSNVKEPADAYMALRMGELSGRPATYVAEQYKSGKYTGWGALAKSLGIKPGSKEFKALKLGHDLQGYQDKQGKNKIEEENKGKTEGKHRGKK